MRPPSEPAGGRPIRRLGDGYEPHVDETECGLVYSLPVDSGHASTSFSFAIRPKDLEVLSSDPYRRAVLECVAHTRLQATMRRESDPARQDVFDRLVLTILHGPEEGIDRLIAAVDRAHNIRTDVYVRAAMARRRAG